MSLSTPTPESPPPAAPQAYVVRHGVTRNLGEFTTTGGAVYPRGSDVVIRSERGHEVGHVLCPSVPQAVAQLVEPTHGQILRTLTAEDCQRVERLRELQRTDYDAGARLIGER